MPNRPVKLASLGQSDLTRFYSRSRLKSNIQRQNNTNAAFVKFENFPIVDEMSGALCEVLGSENPSFTQGVSGRALKMQPRTGVSVPFRFFSRSRFTLGFWLKPVWLSPSIDRSTGDQRLYRMPIVNYSNISLNQSNDEYEASTGFCVFEECLPNGTNILYIFLDGGDGNSCLMKSISSYSADRFRNFYISYSGSDRKIALFIDGKRVLMDFIQGVQVPLSLLFDSTTPAGVQINTSAIGYSGLVRKNFGSLDEFYIQNEYSSSSEVVARHINFGTEFVLFNNLRNQEQAHMVFAFDDPSSLNATAVHSNGNSLYVGRSDGRLYRGDKLLWQSRIDFSNSDEEKYIRKRLLAKDSQIKVEDGVLKITKGVARL